MLMRTSTPVAALGDGSQLAGSRFVCSEPGSRRMRILQRGPGGDLDYQWWLIALQLGHGLGHIRLLLIRCSAQRIVSGIAQMAQGSQVERLKFGRLRDNPFLFLIEGDYGNESKY